jgi:hypothetical protein
MLDGTTQISWREKKTFCWWRTLKEHETRTHTFHAIQIGIPQASPHNFPPVCEECKKQHVKQIVIFRPAPDPLPVCFLSLFIAICMHAIHTSHEARSGTTIHHAESNKRAGRLYAVAGSHAMQSASPSRYELAESRSCGEARALTSTLRANRYLPWWSPARHATDRQQPSERESVLGHKHLACAAPRVVFSSARSR